MYKADNLELAGVAVEAAQHADDPLHEEVHTMDALPSDLTGEATLAPDDCRAVSYDVPTGDYGTPWSMDDRTLQLMLQPPVTEVLGMTPGEANVVIAEQVEAPIYNGLTGREAAMEARRAFVEQHPDGPDEPSKVAHTKAVLNRFVDKEMWLATARFSNEGEITDGVDLITRLGRRDSDLQLKAAAEDEIMLFPGEAKLVMDAIAAKLKREAQSPSEKSRACQVTMEAAKMFVAEQTYVPRHAAV